MSEMHVHAEISNVGEAVRCRFSHPVPIPPIPQEVFTGRAKRSTSRAFDVEGWQLDEDGEVMTLQQDFHGPRALGSAVRWCEQMRRALGHWNAEERSDRQPIEGYSLRCSFMGRAFESVADMCAAFESMPPSDFALGAFELSQPQLLASDPGYYLHLHDHVQVVIQAEPGQWHAKMRLGPAYGDTCSIALQVQHESVDDRSLRDWRELERLDRHASIDTAQCGFFDRARYPLVEMKEPPEEAFYELCCAFTSYRGPGFAVVEDQGRPIGVVADSGGDGGANIYVQRDPAGKVVLAQMVFLGDGMCSNDR